MGRKKHRDKCIALVRKFKSSNLTPKEFCELYGMTDSQLYYWRKKLDTENQPVDTSNEFIEAEIVEQDIRSTQDTNSQPEQPNLVVELPYGVKLKFYGEHKIG